MRFAIAISISDAGSPGKMELGGFSTLESLSPIRTPAQPTSNRVFPNLFLANGRSQGVVKAATAITISTIATDKCPLQQSSLFGARRMLRPQRTTAPERGVCDCAEPPKRRRGSVNGVSFANPSVAARTEQSQVRLRSHICVVNISESCPFDALLFFDFAIFIEAIDSRVSIG